MIALESVLRTLRKPALALMAAAGLFAAIGVPTADAPEAPTSAWQGTLSEADRPGTPALGQSGAPTTLFAESGNRQSTRAPVTGGDALVVGGRTTTIAGGAVAPAASSRLTLPRSRPGRESAPSTGPPSFPS